MARYGDAYNMMQPIIILVEPQMAQNIGKAARAMLNFGLTQLRLVKPCVDWLNKDARSLAAGADNVLENVQSYDHFNDAIADVHKVYATSARPRDMIKDVMTPREATNVTFTDIQYRHTVAFIFGPERTGLHNDHLARADALISIPVNPDFSSLNLAQAVVVMAYEWYQTVQENLHQTKPPLEDNFNIAKKGEIEGFLNQLEQALQESGYFRTTHKQPLMTQNLRNIFARNNYTSHEVRTLRGVVSTLMHPRKLCLKNYEIEQETD